MKQSNKYQSAANNVPNLGSIIPLQLVKDTTKALDKLKTALGGDVSGYVANRLHMNMTELCDSLAAEQVDGVALAMYNIEKRAQSVIIGDQTGIGKGRQAAAMIRYGLLSGYLPIFFTERYTLFSDMYRDCKALGIKDARPLVVNSGACVVDFDHMIENKETDLHDDIWTPVADEEDDAKIETQLMKSYQMQYEVVYKSPNKKTLHDIFTSGDISTDAFDYLMITYSQLKDAKKDDTRLYFLQSLCEKHRVLFIFDEAHRCSSVSSKKLSIITQGVNKILSETPQTQCVFLSATFAKRPESLITFMRRTVLSALATEDTLEKALLNGGTPMQEYVSSSLAAEGQMIRRDHSSERIPSPTYTYLDDDLVLHSELFDKVMFFFREIVKLSLEVRSLLREAQMHRKLLDFNCYPTRSQLFYINKVLLLSLKAQKVAEVAINDVRKGKSVVIGMSDTLECVLRDVLVMEDGSVRGDISALLLRLIDKTVCSSPKKLEDINILSGDCKTPIFDLISQDDDKDSEEMQFLIKQADEVRNVYKYIIHSIKAEVFHLPMSPIDVIRQLITQEKFVAPDGNHINIRFEECTGRAHQLEYLSPEGNDDFIGASLIPRKKRHSNHIFNDFQNNKLDVILINACGAIGASAHAISTVEVPDAQVRQRKMLIVQNDLDVNIDLQKRGRINRTGQRIDLPPLYEYIITAIPSEKRLNMMLRGKLRSLSANTAAWQDHDKEQADFIDIGNKYGNDVVEDYLNENPELKFVLELKGKPTASKVLARIAMLSVDAQQDIVDDLVNAYTSLEAELRRVNQWDLEREFRDFEAEFVKEELFTTAKEKSRLGGCSYLSTYKCKQKSFPYTFTNLKVLCDEAKQKFGSPYKDNPALQNEIKNYYYYRNKATRERFKERRALLYDSSKRILKNYCYDDNMLETWLQKAVTPSAEWASDYFQDVATQKKSDQIMRKLISFSNEYNHLIAREKKELNKYNFEKKRLLEILSKAEIGKNFYNVVNQIASDESPQRVFAVLRDIRFGKEDKNKFLPSKVEFVFALSAVYTEIHINMVHNNKLSNYARLLEIFNSEPLDLKASDWDAEIAQNNNKIVERKIITGNILGAYVHPAIAELKPRFISFSLKDKSSNTKTQLGLLLPMDESKIRQALQNVSIPLHEGLKYATNTNTSYTIAGLGADFALLPSQASDNSLKFFISVQDKHSKAFECDKRFDSIRSFFNGSARTSIYSKDDIGKNRTIIHYQTEALSFESESLQTIIQQLAQLDAVIIVPRDQISYGDVKEFISRSERDENEPWDCLNWKDSNDIPKPPIKEKLRLRISAPIVKQAQKGQAVFRHSKHYILAKETMSLIGLKLDLNSTLIALRRSYMSWRTYLHSPSNSTQLSFVREMCKELSIIIENKNKATVVNYSSNIKEMLQSILDKEYLEPNGLYITRFEEEMLFFSPKKETAQAFLYEMPCSPRLEGIRQCIQNYLDGKTDIINSPYSL